MSRSFVLSVALLACTACSKTTSEPPTTDRAADTRVPVTPASASAMAAGSDASATHAGHATFGVAPGSSAGPGVGKGPADVAYEAPKAWATAPNPNTMRKATFKIPKAAGDAEDAELAISSAGGSIQANVDRWAGQFGGATPTTTTRQVHGLDVTVVELKGSFTGGGPMMGGGGGPKEKYMLLGAMVNGGDVLHFFKLVGPEKTVTAARGDFDRFVGTFKAK